MTIEAEQWADRSARVILEPFQRDRAITLLRFRILQAVRERQARPGWSDRPTTGILKKQERKVLQKLDKMRWKL